MKKCSECHYCDYWPDNTGTGFGRYYCTNIEAASSVNSTHRLIAKTERDSNELPIKTAPRWCPCKFD